MRSAVRQAIEDREMRNLEADEAKELDQENVEPALTPNSQVMTDFPRAMQLHEMIRSLSTTQIILRRVPIWNKVLALGTLG